MENNKPTFNELFEQEINFPDFEMQERYSLLIGLDETKNKLQKILGLLINPDGILQWANKHHPDAKKAVSIALRRPPLIILAGDVGAGKSELAFTIGDAVARQENIDIKLLPLSLSTRGQGRVGQMTQLISSAFEYTIEKAKKLKNLSGKSNGAVILVIDEADALAQSRESDQMHHEDKAGVNAFIRGIDSLANGKYPAAVIMCTNRPDSLDPAIKRRAAEIIIFKRPTEKERFKALETPLTELGLSQKIITEIASLTGPQNGRDYGFTFSDLMQRVVPSIILDAYPNNPVESDRVIEIVKNTIPTSPFKEN